MAMPDRENALSSIDIMTGHAATQYAPYITYTPFGLLPDNTAQQLQTLVNVNIVAFLKNTACMNAAMAFYHNNSPDALSIVLKQVSLPLNSIFPS